MLHQRITLADRPVASSAIAAELLAPCFDRLDHEQARLLHLDENLRLVMLGAAIRGYRSGVDLPLRMIAGDALALGTRALVLAHNHPAGNPAPSPTDRLTTRRLAETLHPLGIRLVDHLIFGAGRWISLRAMGLM